MKILPKICLLRWYFPSLFDEFCKILQGFISYLQKVNDNNSVKLSQF